MPLQNAPVPPAKLAQLAKSLKGETQAEVYFDRYQCSLYSTDASIYRIEPVGVVVPRTAADVARTVQLAAEHDVPIIARGSGTSLSGQTVGRGLVVDCSKYLNRMVEIDPEAGLARVEPGVVLDQLNAAAARYALQFGPDVATSNRANLGGMIGNNSAGSRSILHGKTVDHVIELDVVLADGSTATLAPLERGKAWAQGLRDDDIARLARAIDTIVAREREEIIARFPAVLRRVSGYNLDEFVPECRQRIAAPASVRRVRQREEARYPAADFNLAKLVVGAEGSLACVTGALVHLVPLPPARGLLVLEFDSLASAIDAVSTILPSEPSAIEIIDGMILRLAAKSLEFRDQLDFVVGSPESLVVVEFSGDTPAAVGAQLEGLAAKLRHPRGLGHLLSATEPALCEHIWACRKASLPLLMGIPGHRKPIAFVEDTAVHPARLPEFVARFRKILQAEGTDGAYYGHASVGCLHIRPLLDTKDREDIARMRRILDRVSDLVLEFEGAMSGEHGDGLARGYLSEKLFGPRLYQAFKEVKHAFDPRNLFNPGKVVDAPSPTENLRFGENYRTLDVLTGFDFSGQGGFAAAAELCNGAGVCRKTQSGTMCPSFMATRDEEHSTRGRANALRLALSGGLPAEELTGHRLYQTFDLCLQCKGCKRECPSNVDVAKLKAEFLHQYYTRHRMPWGVKLMAHVGRMNRYGAALAPVSNWTTLVPGARWIGEKLLGIDRRRQLPRFARPHFRQWFRSHRARTPIREDRPVVLLDDCLTSYLEPDVNRAAVELLESCGEVVQLAGLECCGRAMISKGLLSDAKRLAADNVARLLPWAERGVPIVGCEPSCLLTLVDDYPDLVPGPAARKVAAACRLVEAHLAERLDRLQLRPTNARLVVHGHCHQKALVGMNATRSLLEAVAGGGLEILDSGCCGMAGSFGYEHFELSMAIGERVLFPAIRHAADAMIVAAGTSCRHQIADGTGRHALHPVELLARQAAACHA